MFSRTASSLDRCELAPSTIITMNSSGCALLTCIRKSFMFSVFLFAVIFQSCSPCAGPTAP